MEVLQEDTSSGGERGFQPGLPELEDTNGDQVEVEDAQEPESGRHVLMGQDNATEVDMDTSEDTNVKVDAKVKEPPSFVETLTDKQENSTPNTSSVENNLCAYDFPSNEKNTFSVSEIVWGKIKSHPWWPGQIIDPSNASNLALKYHRKDSFLVAYFGDKTFAWCDVSQLKPFLSFFSQMEKQSSSDAFTDAVSDALDEVSSRVQLGMVCPCMLEASYSKLKSQIILNAGVKKGLSIPVQDRSLALSFFQPSRFVEYIASLAKLPKGSVGRLDVTITQAISTAFYRSKACATHPQLFSGQSMLEVDGVSLTSEMKNNDKEKSEYLISAPVDEGKPTLAPVRRRGRPKKGSLLDKQKNILENGRKQKSTSEVSRDDNNADMFGDGEQRSVDRSSDRLAATSENAGTKVSSPIFGTSFKLGDCIRRVATKLIGSSPVPDNNGEDLHKSAMQKIAPVSDSPFGLDPSPPSLEEMKKMTSSIVRDCPSLGEMLSQLHIAASNPTGQYDFVSTTIEFFSATKKMRGYKYVGQSREGQIKSERIRNKIAQDPSPVEDSKPPEVIKRKRGRPRKHPLPAEETTPPIKTGLKRGRKPKNQLHDSNNVQDVESLEKSDPKKVMRKPNPLVDSLEVSPEFEDWYWNDMVIDGGAEEMFQDRKRKDEPITPSIIKKTKSAKVLPDRLSSIWDVPKHVHFGSFNPSKSHGLAPERKIKYFGKKSVEKSTPTALMLSFSYSDSVPSKTDLMRIFSRYGPLKEIEVQKKVKCATVIFRRKADAQAAFSSAGKWSFFGPTLRSYSLTNLPSNSRHSLGQKDSAAAKSNEYGVDGTCVGKTTRSANLEIELTRPAHEKLSNCSNFGELNWKDPSLMENYNVEVPHGTTEALYAELQNKPKDGSGHEFFCDYEVRGFHLEEVPAEFENVVAYDTNNDAHDPKDKCDSEAILQSESFVSNLGMEVEGVNEYKRSPTRAEAVGADENLEFPGTNHAIPTSVSDTSVRLGVVDSEHPAKSGVAVHGETPTSVLNMDKVGAVLVEERVESERVEAALNEKNLEVPGIKQDTEASDVWVGVGDSKSLADGDLAMQGETSASPLELEEVGNFVVERHTECLSVEAVAGDKDLEVQGVDQDTATTAAMLSLGNSEYPMDAEISIQVENSTSALNSEAVGTVVEETHVNSDTVEFPSKDLSIKDIISAESPAIKIERHVDDTDPMNLNGKNLYEAPTDDGSSEILNNTKDSTSMAACNVKVQVPDSNLEVMRVKKDEAPLSGDGLTCVSVTVNPADSVADTKCDKTPLSSNNEDILDNDNKTAMSSASLDAPRREGNGVSMDGRTIATCSVKRDLKPESGKQEDLASKSDEDLVVDSNQSAFSKTGETIVDSENDVRVVQCTSNMSMVTSDENQNEVVMGDVNTGSQDSVPVSVDAGTLNDSARGERLICEQ